MQCCRILPTAFENTIAVSATLQDLFCCPAINAEMGQKAKSYGQKHIH